jgi:hypothetical protein
MERTPPAAADAGNRAQATAEAAAIVRPLPVAVGQFLQATVVAQSGSDVWLGWRGGVFTARAASPLEAGRTYEFVVVATSPQIELAPAPKSTPTPPADAAPLPPGGRDLLALLQSFAANTAPSTADRERASALPAPLAAALRKWASGRPTAAALSAFDRELGHEHEARVLRLLALPLHERPEAALALRQVAKAAALREVEAAAAAARPAPEASLALTLGLGQIERDNAVRSERGAPLWLPLPACPDAGLRDARMFFVAERDAGGDRTGPGDVPFTIVLLLDLTRLGELRVDVLLRDDTVDVTFLTLRSDAVPALHAGLDDLRKQLQDAGLSVRRLDVRQAARPALPIADLVLPPTDGTALVDLHA